MRVQIGDWLADKELDELRRGDERVKLDRRAMALLQYLAARPGEVVSTEELLDNVWRGVVVAPSSVYQTIAVLRRALGDDADEPRYIATVQRRGYRLIANVEPVPEGRAAASKARQPWRWPALMLAIAVLAGVAFLIARDRVEPPAPMPGPRDRSIAVLPFAAIGAPTGEEYLADGLTEGVLQSLGQVPGMRVTARSSVFVFRERLEDLRAIARVLSVRYLLDGSVRRAGAQMKVGVQLVDGATGLALWSATYDRPLGDAIRLPQEIARSVAQTLELVLSGEALARLARGSSLDPLAVDAYLRGRAYWSERNASALRIAREHFARAIHLEPQFAAAHSAMAELVVLLPFYGIEPPDRAFADTRAAAQRALALDPGSAEARAVLAVVLYQHDWQWDAAEDEFRRAIELNPNHATTRQWYAEFLSYAGRAGEAEVQIAVASDLDPLSPTIATQRGSPALWSRSFADAERTFRAAAERYPHFALAHYSVAMSMLGLDRAQEAVAEFEKARPLLEEEFVAPSLAHALVAVGRGREAEALLEKLIAAERDHYVSSYKIAVLLTALGRTDAALARLEEARRARDDRLVLIGVDSLLDPLRSDARFVALQQQVMGTAR